MPKFEKAKVKKSSNAEQTSQHSFDEELNDFDFEDTGYNAKTKVKCICPKCGKQHFMSFRWIGRGTPRKYCPACKGGPEG